MSLARHARTFAKRIDDGMPLEQAARERNISMSYARLLLRRGRMAPAVIPNGWTAEEDAILCDGVADGLRFPVIARMVGRSENACIGRFSRISKKIGA